MAYNGNNQHRQFIEKLVPTTKWPIVGVKMPYLRAIAKEAIQQQVWERVLQKKPNVYEDLFVHAFIIASAPVVLEKRLQLLEAFFPFMDNWAIVDSLCSSLKETKTYKAVYWQWLQTLSFDEPYVERFVYVMYLHYFIDELYIEDVLQQLEQSTSTHYYVHMAVAWATSIAYIKKPHMVMPFLQTTTMPTKNYNKALQKICESTQVTNDVKAHIKKLKRSQ